MFRRSLLAFGAGSLLARPAIGFAQGTWPSQPVRLIVPFAAGGPTDVPARLFADEMTKSLPQKVLVENRTGAGVVVGSEVVAKAPKDGETLLYTTIAHAVLRPLFPRLPFDPTADFAPVALLGTIPMVLLVNKDLPAQTLPELIALLRANPGKYDYGSSGNGGAVHLATELFLARAGGLKMNHVPYRGTAAAMPDLLAGRIAVYMDVAATGIGWANRGEVRALGVSADRRLTQLPQVPTFAEAGVKDAESYTWHMVMAPAGTPAPVLAQANAACNRVAADPAVAARLTDLAMTLRADSTPDSARRFLLEEEAKWSAVIAAAGIRVE